MRILRLAPVLAALSFRFSAVGSDEIRVSNWQVAPYGMPGAGAAREAGVRSPENERSAPPRDLLAVPTPALSFTGIAPCRVADTRNAAFPAGYGPPFMAAGVPRDFTITGRCGIPSNAQAVSFNFTVTNTAGPGFLLSFPQGGVQPTVSTLNYLAGEIIANAAVVSLGPTGAITTIPGVSGFDLIIDVNGYYATPQGASSHLLAVGAVAPGGSVHPSFTNLGTWTSSRLGTGSYEIVLPGLDPGCLHKFPTPMLSGQNDVVFFSTGNIACDTGDTSIVVSTVSPANVVQDGLFFFSIYGPSPVASPLTASAGGRMPTTCTISGSTGVETCE